MQNNRLVLAPLPRIALGLAAALNVCIGLVFLSGPETGINPWPAPLPREMMRFVGAIVIANGAGAAMIFRRPIWENAHVLVAVALVYGSLVFLSLAFDLRRAGAPFIFWIYLMMNTIFLVPAGYFCWKYEQSDPAGKEA